MKRMRGRVPKAASPSSTTASRPNSVYRRDDAGQITILHTGVPPAIGGRGIAGELVRTALDWAKAAGLEGAPGVQLFEGLGGETPGVQGRVTRLEST